MNSEECIEKGGYCRSVRVGALGANSTQAEPEPPWRDFKQVWTEDELYNSPTWCSFCAYLRLGSEQHRKYGHSNFDTWCEECNGPKAESTVASLDPRLEPLVADARDYVDFMVILMEFCELHDLMERKPYQFLTSEIVSKVEYWQAANIWPGETLMRGPHEPWTPENRRDPVEKEHRFRQENARRRSTEAAFLKHS